MERRSALAYDADELDRQVDALMRREHTVEEPEAPARKTRKTPHERERIPRKMGVTWPDVSWLSDLQEQCNRLGCRPSDLIVLAYAHLRAGVESGEIQLSAVNIEYWRRAGEAFDLPWEPE